MNRFPQNGKEVELFARIRSATRIETTFKSIHRIFHLSLTSILLQNAEEQEVVNENIEELNGGKR